MMYSINEGAGRPQVEHINEAMYRLVREHGLSVLALLEMNNNLTHFSS